jgi:hypothetical protein
LAVFRSHENHTSLHTFTSTIMDQWRECHNGFVVKYVPATPPRSAKAELLFRNSQYTFDYIIITMLDISMLRAEKNRSLTYYVEIRTGYPRVYQVPPKAHKNAPNPAPQRIGIVKLSSKP